VEAQTDWTASTVFICFLPSAVVVVVRLVLMSTYLHDDTASVICVAGYCNSSFGQVCVLQYFTTALVKLSQQFQLTEISSHATETLITTHSSREPELNCLLLHTDLNQFNVCFQTFLHDFTAASLVIACCSRHVFTVTCCNILTFSWLVVLWWRQTSTDVN